MGTRADFYVGRGPDAEWIGSIACDGYPSGVERDERHPDYLDLGVTEEGAWRSDVADFLAAKYDATQVEQGWPWPWDDSRSTDYSYAFDGGKVWASCFGHEWFDAADPPEYDDETDDEDPTMQGAKVEFPDMTERKNVQFGGRRSGLIAVTPGGVL